MRIITFGHLCLLVLVVQGYPWWDMPTTDIASTTSMQQQTSSLETISTQLESSMMTTTDAASSTNMPLESSSVIESSMYISATQVFPTTLGSETTTPGSSFIQYSETTSQVQSSSTILASETTSQGQSSSTIQDSETTTQDTTTLNAIFSTTIVSDSIDTDANITIMAEFLNNSILVTKGLNETIAPFGENVNNIEAFQLPSDDKIKNLTSIAEEKCYETEEQNKQMKDMDTHNNKTSAYGPHYLTDDESLKIHKSGVIIGSVIEAIVENSQAIEQGGKVMTASTQNTFLSSSTRYKINDLIQRLCPHAVKLESCPYKEKIYCSCTEKYRTIDGSCNNLDNPYWGKSHTPFDRFITPYYEGTQAPRTVSRSGAPLPGARDISLLVHVQSLDGDMNNDITNMVMQWGQFLDHDITKTALSKGVEGKNLECCNTTEERSDCFKIPIPENDPYFPSHKTCLNFARSVAAPKLDCVVGYREQLNELTHFIDASNVYGSTEEDLKKLRDGTTEKLKMSDNKRLPLDSPNDSGCIVNNDTKCFLAGDKRANVQPGLMSLHTIFVREHNRIAEFIRANNLDWSNEKVFQEARRFVAAEMQHITFNDFLPKVLHDFFMEYFQLKPQYESLYFTDYNPNVKPMIRNAFATAAFRFGHSLLRDKFKFGSHLEFLHKHFNNPDVLFEPNGIENCTRGLYEWESQGIDEKITPELTNKLFETMSDFGGDLAAFNIQRGRDHGIPPYNEWLQSCYGIRANNFNPGVYGGLYFHDVDEASKLAAVYEHPDDMDLFTAAISEKRLSGSKLGPTFSCIIGLQFQALKFGDRFYYEGDNSSHPHSFTITELDSIRNITLAKIICNNTDIESIQADVFLPENPVSNPRVKCTDLPSLHLPCTPVDGGWSDWSSDGCAADIDKQSRMCNNPKPNACGKHCCH